VKQFNNMDSRGSSIFGRASSSDDSTCNQEEYNNSQSYRNHFFDDLRKFPEMGNAQHEAKEDVNSTMEVTNVFFRWDWMSLFILTYLAQIKTAILPYFTKYLDG